MKKPALNTLILAISICLLFQSCQQNQMTEQIEKEVHPLLGSWEMTSIHWMTSDTTYSIPKAQPGLFMIDSARYSIMWTPQEEPRIPFVNLSQPTPEEMQAGFRSVVFNGGSYVMTDSTLTTTAQIAKVPGFEGGKQYYRFTLDQDQLTLIMFDETYPDGTKPSWYGMYQTKFVLNRVR